MKRILLSALLAAPLAALSLPGIATAREVYIRPVAPILQIGGGGFGLWVPGSWGYTAGRRYEGPDRWERADYQPRGRTVFGDGDRRWDRDRDRDRRWNWDNDRRWGRDRDRDNDRRWDRDNDRRWKRDRDRDNDRRWDRDRDRDNDRDRNSNRNWNFNRSRDRD